jgi:hypothetical protein
MPENCAVSVWIKKCSPSRLGYFPIRQIKAEARQFYGKEVIPPLRRAG